MQEIKKSSNENESQSAEAKKALEKHPEIAVGPKKWAQPSTAKRS
jgi:hypothetical protein